MLEKDMYASIKLYLETRGYTVKAEVLDADIMAIKDDETLIIEMKKTLTTRLMYQGCKGQSICDYVYVAIIKPTKRVLKSTQFKEKVHLLRRLHLGLLYIDVANNLVEPYLDPKEYSVVTKKIKKRKLLKEFEQRTTSFNVGGVTKTKIITAYREQAILLAYYLSKGPLPLKEIKALSKNNKVPSIIQKNYYGWFERVSRGIYTLTEKGHKALEDYKHVLDILLQSIEKNNSEPKGEKQL